MTITTVLGSPRKNGNTARVLREFENRIQSQANVRRINVVDVKINGCRGCDTCQRVMTSPGCVQRDGLNETLSLIMAADIVIYAAPVYVWDFPAQMKALMDRHYCLAKNTSSSQPVYLLKGKPTVLLTTCGGSTEENADLLREIFQREMGYLQCRVIGEYVLPFCTAPSELGSRAQELADQMARNIVSEKRSLGILDR